MENFNNDLLEYQHKMNLTMDKKDALRREYIIHLFYLRNLLSEKHIVQMNTNARNNETGNEE